MTATDPGSTVRRLAKLARYGAVSLTGLVITQSILAVTIGWWGWPVLWANLLAVAGATGPMFQLSRRWVWHRDGASHLTREVIPFWAINFVAFAASTAAELLSQSVAPSHRSHPLVHFLVIDGAAIGALAAVWLFRFWVFERLIFVDRDAAHAAGDQKRGRAR
jgi:putative flippase GtrA